MKNILYTLIAVGLIFTSCTVTKRKYLSGYSVDFKKALHAEISQNSDEAIVFENETVEIDTVNRNEFSKAKLSGLKAQSITDSIKNTPNVCDTIFLVDGSQIPVRIQYVKGKVNYKLCDDKNGLYKSVAIEKVSKIKYADGRTADYSTIEKGQKKIEKTGLRGIGFSVAGFIIFIIGALLLASGFGFGALVFSLGLLAIILGIVSICKTQKKPNLYHRSGQFFAILSILFGLILLSLGILILL